MDMTYKKKVNLPSTLGQEYEYKMAGLLYLRALNGGVDFQMATNVGDAGVLEDIVIRHRPRTDDDWSTTFVQLKHRENKSSTLQRNTLLEPTGKFSLAKYFDSCLKIAETMENSSDETLDNIFDGDLKKCSFHVITNMKPGPSLEEQLCVDADPMTEFLGTGSSGSVFSFADRDKNKDVYEMLERRWEEREKGNSNNAKLLHGESAEYFVSLFLKNFRLHCSQPAVSELDAHIKVELEKQIEKKNGDVDIERLHSCYIEEMREWSANRNNINVLHQASNLFPRAWSQAVALTYSSRAWKPQKPMKPMKPMTFGLAYSYILFGTVLRLSRFGWFK